MALPADTGDTVIARRRACMSAGATERKRKRGRERFFKNSNCMTFHKVTPGTPLFEADTGPFDNKFKYTSLSDK